MFHYVYKITNLLNGKIYVGKHSTDDLNDGYMGSGKLIVQAIKKHGVENFSKEILKFCNNAEELNMLEKQIVDAEFTNRSDTYNLREGGTGGKPSEELCKQISDKLKGRHLPDEVKQKISTSLKGNTHLLGYHFSDESKKKISDGNKGKKLSEETKKLISDAKKGENNPWYGKHLSDETKKKISEATKGEKNPMYGNHIAKEDHPMYGKHHTEETKQKIREAVKGEKSCWYGKHHTEETKQKIADARKGIHHSDETKQKMREAAKLRRKKT